MAEDKIQFNFLINCSDEELPELLELADFSKKDMERSDLGWCLQTFYYLKTTSSLRLSCSNKLQKRAVNIVHSSCLQLYKDSYKFFIVCIKADFPFRPWAQFHIVQNLKQVRRDSQFLPFWVQPALVRRNPSRGRVKRVAYTGVAYNGNLAETEEWWSNKLKDLDLEFEVLSTGKWNNLSEVDILIGIRSFDQRPYDNKPPSKLINAWTAGIPFIGGYDSAYRQLGKPGSDYLIAGSGTDALQLISRLKEDQVLFSTLVNNGKRKAALYSNENIGKSWEHILTDQITKRFQTWKKGRPIEILLSFFLFQVFLLRSHFITILRYLSLDYRWQKKIQSNKRIQ